MRIVTITDEKHRKVYELPENNNLADRPNAFINFVSFLCKKYKLNLSKIAKTNADERNLGVELLDDKIIIQFFYEYDINTLELVLGVDFDEELQKQIECDIWKYIKTVEFKKGEEVSDDFGEDYILQEDVKVTKTLTSYRAIRISDNTECKVYGGHIYPKMR
ncbi:hypothetical protein [Clostridium sardiniense]|uniref:hypothetical protein n=1 Tax=Clostridium sardiniense TaxID=29369 RepID=UPI0019587F30|nr:hypothetical protein [Clostridium sardiniense]MBM7836338.1 hypothetical protein [Clostridium sardiniense]